MLNYLSDKNFHSLYYTPDDKSSKLGLFSAAKVVLPHNVFSISIFSLIGAPYTCKLSL